MISRTADEIHLLIAEFPPLTRRCPSIKIAAPQYLSLRHQATGSQETAGFEDCPVHNDGTHANQAQILNLTTVQDDPMPNRHTVADDAWSNAMTGMEDTMILNIGTGANPNIMHITAQHALKPDAGILSNPDPAHNISRLGDECGG